MGKSKVDGHVLGPERDSLIERVIDPHHRSLPYLEFALELWKEEIPLYGPNESEGGGPGLLLPQKVEHRKDGVLVLYFIAVPGPLLLQRREDVHQ
jgi:hypothetical protein